MSEACKAVTVAKDTGISVNLSCSSRRSSFSRLVAKDSAQKTHRRRTKREVEDDVADAVEVSVGSRLFPLACLHTGWQTTGNKQFTSIETRGRGRLARRPEQAPI